MAPWHCGITILTLTAKPPLGITSMVPWFHYPHCNHKTPPWNHFHGVEVSLSSLWPTKSSVDHGSNRHGSPRFLGKNHHTPPNFLELQSQLSIWIFMPHRSDVYEKVAFRSEESPPFLRFTIRPIPVARRAKTCQKSLFFVRFRSRRNGHWPHWNSENGRWIYGWLCIIFVYITLF